MDKDTLMAGLQFGRDRLLGVLETIEKSGQDPAKVLGWRPGPGRAHIGWQGMHCAATLDRYLHALLQQPVKDQKLVDHYGGGSKPSDENIPTLAEIREKLKQSFEPLRAFVLQQTPQTLQQQKAGPGGKSRSVAESIMLLTWHEAHHQGQIHLTWNLYKAAHGLS